MQEVEFKNLLAALKEDWGSVVTLRSSRRLRTCEGCGKPLQAKMRAYAWDASYHGSRLYYCLDCYDQGKKAIENENNNNNNNGDESTEQKLPFPVEDLEKVLQSYSEGRISEYIVIIRVRNLLNDYYLKTGKITKKELLTSYKLTLNRLNGLREEYHE